MQLTTHPLQHLPIHTKLIWRNKEVEYWGIEYYLHNRQPIYRILVPGEDRYRSVQLTELKGY